MILRRFKAEAVPFVKFKLSAADNKNYVFKEGKWSGSEKEDTRVDGTQEEYGECPVERQGQRNDITDLYAMIKEGLTNYEIIESNPQYMLNIDKIERVRPSGKVSEYIVSIFITPFLFVRKTVFLLSFLHQNTHKILVSLGFLDYVVLHDTIIYEYITQNFVKFLN